MNAKRIKNLDGTSCIMINEAGNDDLKHLYIRIALSNNDIVKAMGDGFGDKKLPDTSFGCEFSEILNDVWD